MMRLISLVLIVLFACGVSSSALAADHNAGLKITGNVYSWMLGTNRGGLCYQSNETCYLARIVFLVSNEGNEPIIVPDLESALSEIRFVDGAGGGSNEIVNSVKPANFVHGRRVLDPGDSFRFDRVLSIVSRTDLRETGLRLTGGRWAVYKEPESVRELLTRTQLKFVFRIVAKDSDGLRDLSRHWSNKGVLPLTDSGEFFLETPAFESNSYWIKPEELP